MKYWLSRQVFTLMLGVFLALGMTLSTVQAADMAAKMATMTSDTDTSEEGGCDGCGGDDDRSAAFVNCAPSCAAPVFAVLPPAVLVKAIPASNLSPYRHLVSAGRSSSPDPYPPRPTNLV